MLSVTIPRGLIIVPVSLNTLEMEFPVAQVTTCFCSLLFTYMIEVFPRINFVIDIQSFIGRRNGFAQICSLQIYPKFVKLRSRSGAKTVNATFTLLFTSLFFGVQMWHLPYLLLCFYKFATYCKKQTCANPFFRSVFENKAIFLYPTFFVCKPCGGPCALVL